ncbi:aminoglycoside phosphotransferase family protein [Streptomyces sp. LX-29]|uniref:phosphotransferase family protein n=1 Tax=Streptomyces sp. LX-29 TaxID=2900152 RepID=UPI00240E1233|nr:phosphotransferase [Streptomyces sp. LX-29]WFB07906.1 aminoglycoside phosphotransferase family protein [Streptomyces sp. LX-29]
MTDLVQLHGGFDEAEMHHVLDRACAQAGLDSGGATLLRGHTNAVVRLASAPVVVKIARRGAAQEGVRRTVAFVRWLMERGFPTVSLHSVQQPIVVDGHPVTFWTYLPQPEHPVSAAQLAAPLHALHHLPLPPVPLRTLDNGAAIRTSLGATTSLSKETLRFLTQRAERLVDELGKVGFKLPHAVVQGDPQHRNALHDGDRVVLCDWDTAAQGQPEWDLVTVEIHCRRFGHGRAHYQQFADAYGFDVTQWSGYQVLRDLRELRMITTNARKATHTLGTLAEVERRIAGLRSEDAELRWHIL